MKRILALTGLLAATALTGCIGDAEAPSADAEGALDTAGKPDRSAQLNLSHIECTEDGVFAHFVLLHAGAGEPGDLTGTYSGGSFGPVASYKRSGNVWHYGVTLPNGDIDIYSAEVTTSEGEVVSLHNPGEYAGSYECGDDPEECPAGVEPEELLCTSEPLGNPGAECGYFGLLPIGKDDGLNGTLFEATMDAYVAIVKSGSGGCAPGESAYQVYVDVELGDPLESPTWQDISHVTYCECPE
jgi:hypothetical protein